MLGVAVNEATTGQTAGLIGSRSGSTKGPEKATHLPAVLTRRGYVRDTAESLPLEST